MRKRRNSGRALLVACLIAILTLPAVAQAQRRGISKQELQRGFEAGFDLVILRPLGLVAVAVGVGAFIPAVLIGAPQGRDGFNAARELFIELPVNQTFQRPLGDF
jgi:hypothetical protein